MKPRFVIVNTCDAPERRHVAEWKEGIGYCYMARTEERHLKAFDGMNPTRPTPIEHFGFDFEVSDHQAVFTKVRPSVATYEDGQHRAWQDRRGGEIGFVLPLVGDVKKRKAARK